MKPAPEIGDIWQWQNYDQQPLLLLEVEEGVPDSFYCLDLADGSMYYMSFSPGIMGDWTRLA